MQGNDRRHTFAASGNRSLPLPSRRRTWLLGCFLDVRNVWIVEVQRERSRHRYCEAGCDYHRRRFSPRILWILARSTIHAVTPALFLSSTSRPLGPSWPWTDVSTNASCLMKALFPCPYLQFKTQSIFQLHRTVATRKNK